MSPVDPKSRDVIFGTCLALIVVVPVGLCLILLAVTR